MEPVISVVVRSHNDEAYVGRTLEVLTGQRCSVPFEILSVDDASTDRTPEIIAGFPAVRRIERPSGGYVPGRTLNRAVAECRGEIVVFNNADAIPLGAGYLEHLTEPLRSGGGVCAAYGNQLPRPDALHLVRKDHLRAFGDGKTAAKWRFFFSLASSAARRKELLEHPFSETIRYSEDVEWAVRAVARGGAIRYVPEAQVEHSHNYTLCELWKRFRGEGGADAEIFGAAPGWGAGVARACMEFLRDAAYLAARPAGWPELFPAFPRRLVQKIAYCRGAADYRKGKNQC
ncbi:MAG: glycosyltransferase [Lentisphaeria bacterium]|nr:glycosyltransferase [Lentisphaeria bacterium]